MPKRTDLKKIAVIGAGPIIIGQACEFDYSGTQACKALKEEGYEVVLVNSNPATIMTDPQIVESTYIEPITPEMLAIILHKERPDAILPTLGGQTALNVAFQLADSGVLDELGIEMIGANREVIQRAEDRYAFRTAMRDAGIDLPHSELARSMDEAFDALEIIGLPCIIRPAFTLGGTGGGIAKTASEFEQIASGGLQASMVSEILIEESLEGWKEFEVEVMRDNKDNVVIVCSIENLDPMGIHTGDSITVAPIQTMTDREYQKLRNWSIDIIRIIGVETGGCNIQFAQNPVDGRLVVIEMNPRVSRSSALASKATGFPIAKIAAKVAIGYTLDELPNDITGETQACFEPTIDYCVVKIPRFTFEKFPNASDTISIQMKSVGEVMAIGRTFKESLQKGLRSMETGRFGLGADGRDLDWQAMDIETIINKLKVPNRDRLFYLRYAMKRGISTDELFEHTGIDPWFLDNIKEIVETEESLIGKKLSDLSDDELKWVKGMGFSDVQLAHLLESDENTIREERLKRGVEAVYKLVDTCGAEFEAQTPYYYSTYEEEDETRSSDKEKILILGGGPNRIGQGIEFDYCCCHASIASREIDYESIMINCNPETVSTDYDTSDRLYFEPLTLEDVLSVIRREKPKGVIVQFGGQTPLNIAHRLEQAGVKILGTSVKSIARAEDREQFSALLDKLKLRQTPNATSANLEKALEHAERIGYPVLMRPSFVLGGAKMEVVSNAGMLRQYWTELIQYCGNADVNISDDRPILIDKFLESAIEIDVDAICDGHDVYIAGIMEHIEEAGIHSGDSSCVLPPITLSPETIDELRESTRKLAIELNIIGLMNMQYAIKDNEIYVLEVNPRASRTVPFVSKVTSIPVAKMAARVILGDSLERLGLKGNPVMHHVGVKSPVFPWTRFPGTDTILGPEMKSTGEVMGIDTSFPMAFAKSQLAVGIKIPLSGKAFLSVRDSDKPRIHEIARQLYEIGFHLVATDGTARFILENQIPVETIRKIYEGESPNIIDNIFSGDVQLIINTPSEKTPLLDEVSIRTNATSHNIPLFTTMSGARAIIEAIRELKKTKNISVTSLQEFHKAVEMVE
ncbi:carbamoyl-phosphate synthase large subunit [bacterium]|nr:carbamoyl-phosphate synthase large subunit [bacterium]